MKLTKNFSLKEFKCPCCGEIMDFEKTEELARSLQVHRSATGAPFKINSASRCTNHNKRVGGSPNSQHLLGTAADISVSGWSPEKRFEVISRFIGDPLLSVGLYGTFIHVDIRPKKVLFWEK